MSDREKLIEAMGASDICPGRLCRGELRAESLAAEVEGFSEALVVGGTYYLFDAAGRSLGVAIEAGGAVVMTALEIDFSAWSGPATRGTGHG